jgi:mono/diheme cytochrome c family protein
LRLTQKLATTSLAVLLAAALAACSVRQPGSLETSLVQGVKRNLTVRGRDDRNPLPATEENIHAGQANFSNYCIVCHGLDGQNTGVPFAGHMSPPVPDLKSSTVQAYTDGQLKWIIDNGIFPSGMPASKGTLNDDEIWEIVHFIRHLPAKGSLGEPAVYGGTPQQESARPESSRNPI